MARPATLVPLACLTATLSLAGCLKVDQNVDQNQDVDQTGQTKTGDEKAAAADSKAATAKSPAAGADAAQPENTELTAEEERLIAADPKTLSPDENRARAHALRKKIMQNPDSPQAKELEEVRAAVLAGEVDPKAQLGQKGGGDITITAPTAGKPD